MAELTKSPEMKILEERAVKLHALAKREFPDSEVTDIKSNDFLIYPNRKNMIYPLWIQTLRNLILAHDTQEHRDFAPKLAEKYKEGGEPEFAMEYR